MNKIRIVIADDQVIICEGLNAILAVEEDFEIVGICHNGQAAIDLCRDTEPDIVLMDARMPVMNGLDAAREIVGRYLNTKVIILTTFNEESLIFEGIRAGVKAFMLKDVQPEELCGCIREVHKGGACLHPDVIVKLMDKLAADDNGHALVDQSAFGSDQLTRREREVLLLIGKGLSNSEIASALYIVEGTVKNHVSNLLAKLETRDRTQLALLAQKYVT